MQWYFHPAFRSGVSTVRYRVTAHRHADPQFAGKQHFSAPFGLTVAQRRRGRFIGEVGMNRESIARSDFAAFEAQFSSATSSMPSRGRRRATGWIGAAVVSLGIWSGLVAGAIALFHW
jgi:hypothetical protein